MNNFYTFLCYELTCTLKNKVAHDFYINSALKMKRAKTLMEPFMYTYTVYRALFCTANKQININLISMHCALCVRDILLASSLALPGKYNPRQDVSRGSPQEAKWKGLSPLIVSQLDVCMLVYFADSTLRAANFLISRF